MKTINRKNAARFLVALAVLCAVIWTGRSAAQRKASSQRLVGTWMLISADNIFPDGNRVHVYGPEPQGMLVFDAQGHYSLHIYTQERLRFAANDKSKGTAEENQSAVRGSNTHFGRYTVNEADASIAFQIDHAFFPNWEGTTQKRSFRIEQDRLTYIVATPTTGGAGAIGEVVWRRAQ